MVGLHEMMHVGLSALGLAQSKHSLFLFCLKMVVIGWLRELACVVICCAPTILVAMGFSGGAWGCEWLWEGKKEGG